MAFLATFHHLGDVFEYIKRIISCQSCNEEHENDQVGNEEIDDRPRVRRSLLKRSLQTGFAITLTALPLGISAIAFLYVGLDVSLILMTRHKIVRKVTQALTLGLYGLEYYNTHFPTAGMVLTIFTQGFTLAKMLHIDNFNSILKVGIQIEHFMWLFVYGLAHVVVTLNARFRLFPRNSSFIVIQYVPLSFMMNFVLSMIVRYNLAPLFIDTKDKMKLSLVIAIAPLLPEIIPPISCTFHASKNISRITNRECSLVFVYLSRGILVIFYSISQADFTGITWQFFGICLLRSFLKVAWKATEKLRGRMWAYVFNAEAVRQHRYERRRFMADIAIQDMLLDCTMTILSQAFVALCRTTNCEVSFSAVLNKALVRIAVQLGIYLFFSCVYVFVLVRWYDIPVLVVWSRYWKYHTLVNVITALVISCMYMPIIQAYKIQSSLLDGEFKNCTSVRTEWYTEQTFIDF